MINSTLCIVGLSHHTAPVEVRERLAFSPGEVVGALASLKRGRPAVTEAALLSTCNRVEMVAAAADPDRAQAELLNFLAAERKLDPSALRTLHYRLAGREAVRHLFRVGASLDSMVVGEPQILGQLKTAYAQAVEAGVVGLILHRAFHKTFSVAKLVRRSTAIGAGAVSVSAAAVKLARQIFDSLHDKTIMLLGAGRMAELTARNLARLGVESLVIVNRRLERAMALARELGGTAVALEHYTPYLKLADVVIGSAAVNEPILTPSELYALMRERLHRPMFLIDLGVPRNFHRGLNELENVFLYDIDDLGRVAAEALSEREQEAHRAELIVEREVDAFCRWIERLDLVPAIKAVRSRIELLRDGELKRHRAWLATLGPHERAHVEALARGLTNKILHQILSELRRLGQEPDKRRALGFAQRLLGVSLAPETAEVDRCETADDKERDERQS
jgi:glutamyl-tRNA reductase